MSRILVTGSEGTLGRPLVKQLEKNGHLVYGLDLKHTEKDKYVRCDIRNYRTLSETILFTKPDFIYHLAAEFGRHNGEHYYEDLWSTNVIGTRNVLEIAQPLGVKVIFASSSEIYGEVDAEVLYEDLSNEKPLFQQNDYALSKWANEVQIQNFIKKYGLEAMTLRFFNAYGPGERYHNYRSVISLFCYRALHDMPYEVYENYYRTFMYIDDFIPTLARACERFDNGGVYNIGGKDYRSIKEASDLILRHAGKDDSLVTYLPEEAHNVKSKKPWIGKATIKLDHDPGFILETGIPATIEWMKDYYELR